jgi:hypothetical protein
MMVIGFLTIPVSAQHNENDYREIVLSIPGIESDKTYELINSIYQGVQGIEIMLRCKKGEMLVLKVDLRIQPNPEPLLRRLTENNLVATVREGFDYNKAVATCSDFKPE